MANNTSTTTTNSTSQGGNPGITDDSFEVARRLQNNTAGRATIEVNAPWRQGPLGDIQLARAGQEFPGGGITHDVRNTAAIKIDVQVLQQNELGLLNATGGKLQQVLNTAMREKHAEDERKFGLNPEQMVQKAKDLGYYGSGAHQAWAEAASARTGGRASTEYMMRLDPLGGTNGNGPKILPGGIYPHEFSRIAMGHDTDWSLGRYFNAGPMNGLYRNTGNDKDLGEYGLQPPGLKSPINPQPRAQYLYGNDIYRVEYNNHPTQTRRAGLDGNGDVAVASVQGTPLERHANQVGNAVTGMVPADKKDDVVAAVLASSTNLDRNKDINVAQSTTRPELLLASQGQGPAALRADPVDVSRVQPGSAQTVIAELVRNTNPQQVAAVEPQVERQTQAPRTM
jgi:hypothetical protein